MSDRIEPEPDFDFATIASDGAYCRIANGIVHLQFYRDTLFPKPDQYGIPTFFDKKRTILHETRMSVETADRFVMEITKYLHAYHEEILEKDGLKEIAQSIQELRQNFDETPKKVADMFSDRVYGLMRGLNAEGHEKMGKLLIEILEENAPKFEEILANYSIKVEGR